MVCTIPIESWKYLHFTLINSYLQLTDRQGLALLVGSLPHLVSHELKRRGVNEVVPHHTSIQFTWQDHLESFTPPRQPP